MTSTVTGRSYGGRSADERDAERRQRLLDAAHDLIGTVGYAATTIEQICKRATVSTRHFYLRYSSKEDVFLDLYRSITEEAFDGCLVVYAEKADEPMRTRIPATVVA